VPREAAKAASITFQLDVREDMNGGWIFQERDEHIKRLLNARAANTSPEIVTASSKRMIVRSDHGRAGQLIEDACFEAALEKLLWR